MLSVRPKLQGILGNGAIFFLQSMRSLVCIGKDHLQILPHKQGQSGDQTGLWEKQAGKGLIQSHNYRPLSVVRSWFLRQSTLGIPHQAALTVSFGQLTLQSAEPLGSCVLALVMEAVAFLPQEERPGIPRSLQGLPCRSGWCLPGSGKASE